MENLPHQLQSVRNLMADKRTEGGAGTPLTVIPPNITILPLPPKCPELNPVENVWQFIRDNWLSNRVFNSYEDILDHCCDAWNKLTDQPWKIMSIGMRDWAHRF
ncbi:transposase [Devosia sp. RR2S18]|uniref:transposase n=1 Tax=Devosia rhizosphaerae TaxID=3049774 RepID=UPI00254003E7|nr:transposase [Devosia sp. RR2S18]WIJ25802.1 transposase [Devosia sp. RR2S18]